MFQVKSLKILHKSLTNYVSKACIKKKLVGYGKEKKKDQKKWKKKSEKHVESARVARRLMTSHGLRGLVRKEKIVQEEAMRSDMWSYLDDDFHVEISDESYHHCLALVCDQGNADTEKFA